VTARARPDATRGATMTDRPTDDDTLDPARDTGGRLTLWRMQNPVRGCLHGAAAAASIVGTACLWARGAGDPPRQLALAVFGLSLLALYTVSSLYHSIPWRDVWKARMQRLDHAMIYVLVAGTYTPIAAIALSGRHRSATLTAVWGIAAVGIAQKALLPQLAQGIALYTIQGWIGPLVAAPLVRQLPWQPIVLIVLGGLLYTAGMVLFVTRRPRLWPRVFSYHEVFHVLVVTASALHYAAIFAYVATI
jgi:hemolysin III